MEGGFPSRLWEWLWVVGDPDTYIVVTLPGVRCRPSPPADKPSLNSGAHTDRSCVLLVPARSHYGWVGEG